MDVAAGGTAARRVIPSSPAMSLSGRHSESTESHFSGEALRLQVVLRGVDPMVGMDFAHKPNALRVRKVRRAWHQNVEKGSEAPFLRSETQLRRGDLIVDVNGVAEAKQAEGAPVTSLDLTAALQEDTDVFVLIVERNT